MIFKYPIESYLVGGNPWYTYPSEKMKVSWDDYSQYDGKNKIYVPNHQPDPMVFLWFSYGFPMNHMVFLWFSHESLVYYSRLL